MTEFTSPSPSEPWSELLAGYVLGDLTPAEVTLVEQYLADHPKQQAEVASLRLPLELMPLSLSPAQPPASLRQSIMQAATTPEAVQKKVVKAPVVPTVAAGPPKFKFGLAALAGLGLSLSAALGWQNYHLHQELARTKQDLIQVAVATAPKQPNSPTAQTVVSLLQQPNNRFLSMKSMGKKPMGMGSLVMAPQQAAAVLTLQKVPPLPIGKVYRVWAILGDGEMACGDFLPDAKGQVLMQLPLDSWGKVNKVTITIEDKSAVHAVGEIAIEGEIQI